MTAKKIDLGRNLQNLGLKELLGSITTNESMQNVAKTNMQKIATDLLHPGKYQPRRSFDQVALEELASSIRAQGLLQPVIVRPCTDKTFEIIAGERRWRAAQLAALHEVPVIVRDINDEQALAVSLIENIQREDLNAIDEAEALQRLCDEFHLSHQEVADMVGRSRTAVTNLLRLLTLTPEVKEMVARGEIDMGHARALLALNPMQQLALAKEIAAKGLSVRVTEKMVQDLQKQKVMQVPGMRDPNILQLEKDLSDKLGASVIIRQQNSGRGSLTIQYHSLEELDGILQHINK
ncbi:MAG: ParB/RepB/Spo0J family partition protein [Gammaproteobacteria bacterium]|jgi:ParB family chromosome partitioning protein